METSNRSKTGNIPERCGRKQLHMISMRISMEQSLKCREVGFEMAEYWYGVLSGRRCKFGFNVHITINTG